MHYYYYYYYYIAFKLDSLECLGGSRKRLMVIGAKLFAFSDVTTHVAHVKEKLILESV